VTTKEEYVGFSIAMGCWGNKIPLKEALFARKVCHTEKYDFGWSQSLIIPNVFVSIRQNLFIFSPYLNYASNLRMPQKTLATLLVQFEALLKTRI